MNTKVVIFAKYNYRTLKTQYEVETFTPKTRPTLSPKETIAGIAWTNDDFLKGEGVIPDSYNSLMELAKAIQDEATNNPNFPRITFIFKHSDTFDVEFCERDSDRKRIPYLDELTRERPLNDLEREQFCMALAFLSEKEDLPNQN